MIKIRTATINDIEQLTDLFEGYRKFYRREADRDGASAFLRARFENNDSYIFVAEERGVLVGFTQLYPLFSSTRMARVFLLNDLFVHQDHRGKSASKLLLKRAQEHTIEHKACALTLETEKNNIIANKLYPKMGFIQETNNYYYWTNNG